MKKKVVFLSIFAAMMAMAQVQAQSSQSSNLIQIHQEEQDSIFFDSFPLIMEIEEVENEGEGMFIKIYITNYGFKCKYKDEVINHIKCYVEEAYRKRK